jgi:hypothetical protein
MKLIDKLRRPYAKIQMPWWVKKSKEQMWADHAGFVGRFIAECPEPIPVILIDNVAEYFYSGTDQEYWDLQKDFPNVAPPYPIFWIENKLQRKIVSKVKGESDLSQLLTPDSKLGVLFNCMPVSLARPAIESHADHMEIPETAHWVFIIEQFVDWGRGDPPEGPVGTITLWVNKQGLIVQPPCMRNFGTEDDKVLTEVLHNYMTWIQPAFLAICFMHCKNVRVVDEEVPTKLAKRTEERHGYKPSPHKRLIIEPLKQILKKEGGSDKNGIAKAMHICRGHFAEYGETYGKGKLFGKYEGKFWIPSTVRGTKSGGKKEDLEREIEIKL